MAPRTLHVTLRTRHIDDLCNVCWTPALLEMSAVWPNEDGVHETPMGTICHRCARESDGDDE